MVLLLSLAVLLSATIQSTLAFIVVDSGSVVNTFVPDVLPSPSDVVVEIGVQKTVKNTGNGSISPEGFSFLLENADSDETVTVRSDKDGSASFSLTFTEPDAGKTYRYTLSEVNDGREGVEYDGRRYAVEVRIAETDGALTATVLLDGKETAHCTATFENTYHGEQIAPAPTGDNSDLTVHMALLLISGAFTAILLGKRRRSNI